MSVKLTGCDMSRYNLLNIDCDYKEEIDFVMLRIGGFEKDGNPYKDSTFEEKYNLLFGKVDIGCYYVVDNSLYQQNINVVKQHLLSLLQEKNYQFTMPIAIDFEANAKDSKYDGNTKAIAEICKFLEHNNYYAIIYSASYLGFKQLLNVEDLKLYDKWVAAWSTTPPDMQCGMWQYTNTGRLSCVQGVVDLDVAFYDYPNIIKNKGLNNLSYYCCGHSECKDCANIQCKRL